jgi:ParB/RepB/Spo0J family partition protein
MNIQVSQIKPDPNQPRRTFDAEKMAALVASIKSDGFRKEYPILIDEENVIVDGERRWRASKQAGLKEVPVEVMKDVKPWQRLLYQLQSEGAELDPLERNKAWVKLWELSQRYMTQKALANSLGVDNQTFSKNIKEWYDAQELLNKIRTQSGRRPLLEERPPRIAAIIQRAEISNKDKVLMGKVAGEQNWDEDKTLEIRKAVEEKPLRAKQILSHDYSSNENRHWKTTLEVAKAGFSMDDVKDLNETGRQMEVLDEQIDAFMDIFTYGLKLQAAMKRFDYTKVTPKKRIELHQKIQKYLPFVTGYIRKLESYMIEKGELKRNVSLLN